MPPLKMLKIVKSFGILHFKHTDIIDNTESPAPTLSTTPRANAGQLIIFLFFYIIEPVLQMLLQDYHLFFDISFASTSIC